MPTRTKLISECEALIAQGRNEEEVITFLRDQGCSKLESIAVLKSAMGVDLNHAKRLVHFSQAWKDKRDEHDKFHEDLETALKNKHER